MDGVSFSLGTADIVWADISLPYSRERPHVSQHLPGFFCQHEGNKGRHCRTLAAVLQDPEQFPVGSRGLPLFVGEISR